MSSRGRGQPARPAYMGDVRIVLNEVCAIFKVTEYDLLGSKRTDKMVLPRVAVATAMRDLLDLSYPVIGRTLHRDHSTIIHHYRRGAKAAWMPGVMKRIKEALVLRGAHLHRGGQQVTNHVPYGLEMYGEGAF